MTPSHILGTCALLDLVADKWQNPSARQQLTAASQPVVHTLSAWEISRKFHLGKLNLPCDLNSIEEFLTEVMQQFQLTWVAPDLTNACRAEQLPMIHKDPVDRMILALALQHQIPVFSSDRRFLAYGCEVINPRRVANS